MSLVYKMWEYPRQKTRCEKLHSLCRSDITINSQWFKPWNLVCFKSKRHFKYSQYSWKVSHYWESYRFAPLFLIKPSSKIFVHSCCLSSAPDFKHHQIFSLNVLQLVPQVKSVQFCGCEVRWMRKTRDRKTVRMWWDMLFN